jgi:hypothetical protein
MAALDRDERGSAGIKKRTHDILFHRDGLPIVPVVFALTEGNDIFSGCVILNKRIILATVTFIQLTRVQGGINAFCQKPLQLLI